jgi:hypothetical protein
MWQNYQLETILGLVIVAIGAISGSVAVELFGLAVILAKGVNAFVKIMGKNDPQSGWGDHLQYPLRRR